MPESTVPREDARRRVVVLVNPAAGTGIRDELGASARLAGLDLDLHVVRAASAGELAAAGALEVSRGVDALVVQGGDGMVHLGVGLVAGTEVPLGIVPNGTGNDFARAAGLPRGRRPDDAIAALVAALANPAASRRRMDALRLRIAPPGAPAIERWVANSVNIGFDALVNERANRLHRLHGTARYLAALVLVARDFTTIPFRVGVDGAPAQPTPGALVTVGNGSSVGGGIRLLPAADPADGELDAMLVRPVSRLALASLFPLAALGLHRRLPQVSMRRATRIRVEAPAGTRVYADGERITEAGGCIEVECVPGAWTLLRGANP